MMTYLLPRIAAASALCLIWAMSPALAQDSDKRVAQERDWGVYISSNPKHCWAATSPKKTRNTRNDKVVDVNRGDILLFTTYRGPNDQMGEVAFTGGYRFAENAPITIQIDTQSFEMTAEGEWAWPKRAEDDAALIEAMRAGSDAVVTAKSTRATKTVDTFSLLGYTAAAEEAQAQCR